MAHTPEVDWDPRSAGAGGVMSPFEEELALLRAVQAEVLASEGTSGLAEDVQQLEEAVASGDVEAAAAIVAEMTPQRAEEVALAVTVSLHLVNLVEEREHARLIRLEDRDEDESDSEWPSLRAVSPTADAVARLEVHPVLTAHPTEARRRAVVSATRRIAEQLDRHQDPRNGATERRVARRRLTEEIEVLWRTEPLRRDRPGPLDEVRTVLPIFEQTLARIVPRLYRETERAIGAAEPGSAPPQVPAFVRFGSWIGSDRDGNPFVTADVTREAAALQAQQALAVLQGATDRVARMLTLHERRTPPSGELRDRLAMDAAAHPELFAEVARSSPGEPHRQALLLAAARLAATRRRDMDLGYRGPEELLADLRMVQRSLAGAGACRTAYGEVQHVIWQVETFGFHLAELEVRQHSLVHEAVLADLLPHVAGTSGDPASLVADAGLLDRLARDGWDAGGSSPSPTTDAGVELLATFRSMGAIQRRWGERACGRYVVSFTKSAAHLVAVRALARLAVGSGHLRLDVVPLFETYDDLAGAVGVLDEWVALPSEAECLDARGRRLEVMVGYSDSAKDVGPVSATLALYRSQEALVEWAEKRQITLTLFHGRGGSLGRGGGPLNRAIVAQPPGSVSGRFKVTEQGEVIAARYANATIGQRHLERVTAAVLQAGSEDVARRNDDAAERFADLGARMERAAREAFLSLVETEGFADFMAAVTPLEEIGQLRLGSRPPKRAGAMVGRDLADLRAIPWVFAWSQSRINLAGWYGLGAGMEAAGTIEDLRTAWEEWPLFAMLVDTAEMSLAKTDRAIAERYLAFGGRPELAGAILDELDRTTRLVLEVLDQEEMLAAKPRLHDAVALRRVPVGALSHLQLRALRELREGAVGERTHAQLLLAVNGIAAGLQNTG